MHKKVFSSLYFQVLLAITLGVFLGHVYPDLGADMKPLGDGFVKLIKMIIAPVIFCTVVTGIAGMESMKAVGKTGAIALIRPLVDAGLIPADFPLSLPSISGYSGGGRSMIEAYE